MFKHRLYESASLKTYVDWFLLAFLSGTVNSGGWLSCHRFVTHVTGFATLAGVEAAERNWHEAFAVLTVPVYFLLGVMVSAYLIDRRIHEGRAPRYGLVMGIESVLLLAAALGGYAGFFSAFGDEAQLNKDYVFLALLCAASGLQNAALTTSSGATIRTTHLTGITTDLGIGLVRSLARKSHEPTHHKMEMQANWLRVGTVMSFMFGSAAGAILFLHYHYLGFLLPAAISGYAMVVAVGDKSR